MALPLALAALPPGFGASLWASGLDGPRGITVAPNGDVLVVERGSGSLVTALWDENGDGLSDANERQAIATAPGLNHGIALHGGYLFASSDTTVYRWPYTTSARADLGAFTAVVDGISADGNGGAPQGHWTRTLKVNDAGRMFISVGSNENVDPNDFRARIRYVDGLSEEQVGPPVDFSTAPTWARGLRNEVGLAFDLNGTLWGVENGADNLFRADLGGDITEENPGEELNRFPGPDVDGDADFYGYPYCWSEYQLPPDVGLGPRTQWAWPSFIETYPDSWCRNTSNVKPPELVMQAHTAPLGIAFFGTPISTEGNKRQVPSCSGGDAPAPAGAFPCSMVGDAFVPLHGSWNRDVPAGYSVVRLPFEDGRPTGAVETLLAHAGDGARWPSGLRPVDAAFLPDGSLLVTSDSSGDVVRITYDAPQAPDAPPQPPATPPQSPPEAVLAPTTPAPSLPTPVSPPPILPPPTFPPQIPPPATIPPPRSSPPTSPPPTSPRPTSPPPASSPPTLPPPARPPSPLLPTTPAPEAAAPQAAPLPSTPAPSPPTPTSLAPSPPPALPTSSPPTATPPTIAPSPTEPDLPSCIDCSLRSSARSLLYAALPCCS